MAKIITIDDIRQAIAYGHDCDIQKFSDTELLNANFWNDLRMGNIRVANLFIELQRIHGFSLPLEIFRTMPSNTVGAFMDVVNNYLANPQNSEQ